MPQLHAVSMPWCLWTVFLTGSQGKSLNQQQCLWLQHTLEADRSIPDICLETLRVWVLMKAKAL